MDFKPLRDFFGERYSDAFFEKNNPRTLLIDLHHLDNFDQGADIVWLAKFLNTHMSSIRSKGQGTHFQYFCSKVPRPPNDARIIAYGKKGKNIDFDMDEKPFSEIMELVNALLLEKWERVYLECSTGDCITFNKASLHMSHAHWVPRFDI